MRTYIKSALYFGLLFSAGLLAHRCVLTYLKSNKKLTDDTSTTQRSQPLQSDSANEKVVQCEKDEEKIPDKQRNPEILDDQATTRNEVSKDGLKTLNSAESLSHENVAVLNILKIEEQGQIPLLEVPITHEKEPPIEIKNNPILSEPSQSPFALATEGLAASSENGNFQEPHDQASSNRTIRSDSGPVVNAEILDIKTPDKLKNSPASLAQEIPVSTEKGTETAAPNSKNGITLPESRFEYALSGNEIEPNNESGSMNFGESVHPPTVNSEMLVSAEQGDDNVFSDSHSSNENSLSSSQLGSSDTADSLTEYNKKNVPLNLSAPEFVPSALAPPLMETFDKKGFHHLAHNKFELDLKDTRCRFWPECKYNSECVFWHPIHQCPNESLGGFNPVDCKYGSRCIFYHAHELKFLEARKIRPPFQRSKGLEPPNYIYLAQYSISMDSDAAERDDDEYLSDSFSSNSRTTYTSDNVVFEPCESSDDSDGCENKNGNLGAFPQNIPDDLHLDDIEDDDDLDMPRMYMPSAQCTPNSAASENEGVHLESSRPGAQLNINAPVFMPQFLEKP